MPALALSGVLTATSPGVAQERVEHHLSALEVFTLADKARAEGRNEDALVYYEALTQDPDGDIRNEARYRRALILAELGREVDAALALRAILDERPDAVPVRLELARILVKLGDEAGALRALRQAQAAGLPPGVGPVVEQFAGALRSSRPFGGTLEFGLAPDSNINRATASRTLETIIAPLTLSEDARQKSGVGLQGSGQVFARMAIADNLTLLPRASGRAIAYRNSAFNDFYSQALIGLEYRRGASRLTPSFGQSWRWYGGNLYATTQTFALSLRQPLGRRAQLVVSGSAGHSKYSRNVLQTGALFDLSATGEYALSARAGLSATIGATRQDARERGYATTSGAVALSGWRDIGATTVFANFGARELIGDERLALFTNQRREWLLQVSAGATFRSLQVKGFAPLVRLGLERNFSSVGLYDYKRIVTEFGFIRAF